MSNSIEGARAERDQATGYADLLAEVEAMEARVTDEAKSTVRDAVEALGNKVRRPPLRADSSNDHNSLEVRRADVDSVRAYAQGLAASDFTGETGEPE
jgi:hypothetical protein